VLSEKCFSQLLHSAYYMNAPILPPTPPMSEAESFLKRAFLFADNGFEHGDLHYYSPENWVKKEGCLKYYISFQRQSFPARPYPALWDAASSTWQASVSSARSFSLKKEMQATMLSFPLVSWFHCILVLVLWYRLLLPPNRDGAS